MKTISKSLMAAALCALPLGAMAETNIDFESADGYKALGVYDVWEASPFRTGVLNGNWGITPNPDKSVNEITGEVANPSDMVLGAQRSRFGSNRFGVRIDLAEEIAISPARKYIHVMIHKPTEGRVMLVGLGSRVERKGQNPLAEQFWVISDNAIEPGRWFDAVFPVRGANGVNVRSLVVVPDCESPHALGEDFLFYVDNITINDSPLPRIANEYYPIIGTKANTAMTRTDRHTDGVQIKIDGKVQSVTLNQTGTKKLYLDGTASSFFAKAGQTITPSVKYSGTWMHAYCYIDFNNDGKFNIALNDNGTPAEGSEVVAYNYYNGHNSKGTAKSDNLGGSWGEMPSFTLPADMKPGMYRMRFKVDWDNIDPMGNPGELIDDEIKNSITSNGGSISDVMLCVYGDEVTVNDFQLNGEVLAGDGTKLNALKVPADQEFTIKVAPEKGFHNGGVDVKCGFNLNGDAVDKYGNPQYTTYFIPVAEFGEDDTYTIPANKMRANILFNGRMTEDGTGSPVAEGYLLNFPEELTISRTDRKLNSLTLAVQGGESTQISCADNTDRRVYLNKIATEVSVPAGGTVTPSVSYTGNAMHTYHYVDLNEDGVFSTDLNEDGTPAGELLSYSHLNGKNSLGATVAAGLTPAVNHPFVIPADTKPGVYRARFKIDWNNSNPGGQYGGESNNIDANGGYVLDYMIHVYTPQVNVSATPVEEAGSLTTAEGTEITADGINAERGTAVSVNGTTTSGKNVETLVARRGYHFDRPAWFKGHNRWTETALSQNASGIYEIAAELLDRPVLLTATYEGIESGIDEIGTTRGTGAIYNLQGIRVDKPVKGRIYIIDGHKVMVK